MAEQPRVAIVTGAAQGIGREIALHLARSGAQVVLADVEEGGLEQTAALIASGGGPAALPVVTDLRKEASVAELVQRASGLTGRVEVLVNNAGISGPIKEVEEISLTDWEETLAVNLTGAFLCCKHVVPLMKRQRHGSIVNIASVVGKRPVERRTPYAASKIAMIGLTRTLALEVGKFKVRVNAICPSGVTGARMDRIIQGFMEQAPGKTREQVIEERQQAIALRTYVEPRSIAEAVLFLCSPAGEMITGQDLNVCAGTIMY